MTALTRISGHLPFDQMDTWLRALRAVWVATTRPDGRPHAVPVWFHWDGAHLYFNTLAASQKARNLARQPTVVVHAGDGGETLILEGTCALVNDPAEREQVNTAYMAKYVDPRTGTPASVQPGTPLYRVRVQRVLWWVGGVHTRTEWRA